MSLDFRWLMFTLGAWCIAFTSIALAQVSPEERRAKDAKIVQTLLRLPGFDLNSKPEAREAVLRHLETLAGDAKYVEIVEKLSLKEAAPGLLKQALAQPDTNVGVQCARLLFKFHATDDLRGAVEGDNKELAVKAITVAGLVEDASSFPWFTTIISNDERPAEVRIAAVQALGRSQKGQRELLDLVIAGKLAAGLQFAAANILLHSDNEETRTLAQKHLPLPASADARPLPPLAELVRMPGVAADGKAIFEGKGTCAKCHVVNNAGKEVGPNLSEIGTKLPREALFVAILDPSAGVSHNYETTAIVTDEGQVFTGIVVSDTAEAITLRTSDAILRTIPRGEIEELKKLKTSLMPSDLQRQLTRQELIDVVEYLTTLKKQ